MHRHFDVQMHRSSRIQQPSPQQTLTSLFLAVLTSGSLTRLRTDPSVQPDNGLLCDSAFGASVPRPGCSDLAHPHR
jgi:hypothetical protein